MKNIDVLAQNIRNSTSQNFSDSQVNALCEHFLSQADEDFLDSFVANLTSSYGQMARLLDREQPDQVVTIDQITENYDNIKRDSNSIINSLRLLADNAEIRGGYTISHNKRISRYSKFIAEKLLVLDDYKNVLKLDFPHVMGIASPIHDIGKIGIAKAILSKNDGLSFGEVEVLKTHVGMGYNIILGFLEVDPKNEFLSTACDIALYHHEKWNGSGYVSGTKEKSIPLSARIVSLAHKYDTLRLKPTDGVILSHEDTVGAIIRRRGLCFDPVVVDIFSKHDKYFDEIYGSTP